jgi:predicted dehydrogenase
MPFRIGIIGAGTHGARYLRHARQDVPGLKPVVLCRRDRQAGEVLAAEIDCRYQQESTAVIADPEVDGLVVCTPPSTHFPLAQAVLAAGKPLLLEKPFTGTLQEAVALCQLDATSAAPPLMLAQTLRWNPVILKVKELWPSLGRVHLLRLAQRLAPTTLVWQRRPEESVGGSVLLTGVHIFDLARFLTGHEFVTVDSRQRNVLHPSLEDNFLAHATLADDTWVSLEVSKYTRSVSCWLEAVGEAGQLLADYRFGGIKLIRGTEVETITAEATAPTLPPVLAAWLAAARGEAPVPVTATDGLRTLEIVEACYRSHHQQRVIEVARRY